MDGIAITDMAALGSSPTYYDFDMFQEMQVTTGGADPANADAGRAAELRAPQRHQHAGARRHAIYFENDDLQSDNVRRPARRQLNSYNRVASTRTTASKAAVR